MALFTNVDENLTRSQRNMFATLNLLIERTGIEGVWDQEDKTNQERMARFSEVTGSTIVLQIYEGLAKHFRKEILKRNAWRKDQDLVKSLVEKFIKAHDPDSARRKLRTSSQDDLNQLNDDLNQLSCLSGGERQMNAFRENFNALIDNIKPLIADLESGLLGDLMSGKRQFSDISSVPYNHAASVIGPSHKSILIYALAGAIILLRNDAAAKLERDHNDIPSANKLRAFVSKFGEKVFQPRPNIKPALQEKKAKSADPQTRRAIIAEKEREKTPPEKKVRVGAITAEQDNSIIKLEIEALQLFSNKSAFRALTAILSGNHNRSRANHMMGGENKVKNGHNVAPVDVVNILQKNPELAEIAKNAPMLTAVAISANFQNIGEIGDHEVEGFFGTRPNQKTKMRDILGEIAKTVQEMSKLSEGWVKTNRQEYLEAITIFAVNEITGNSKLNLDRVNYREQ